MTDLAKLMDEALGVGVMSTINGAFACMEIAEEEIKASGCDKDEGSAAFGVLCPSEPLRGKSPDVYRAHCKEMIARVTADNDTRPGTNAEVLCSLLATSLLAPLNESGMALADHLFANCFPDYHDELPSPMERALRRESYKGQIAEDLVDARKRCAVRDRVVS